ncbi:MAG TPA: 3-isopropylmalate dehydratase small subunit [Hellea balneolensis]|uniref:3-isopropylmalate dehydratase small subunit n=1 Tax=Hellea balneolensis TaxID=287478 RepID=A0A7V5U104_9PROT|nr:3-isopropylmalate dehydratase small subunit [Hellea balneolensis]
MSFEPFVTLKSKTLVLPAENIDTDQIIPARFLTTTSREGLGRLAFYDWRYDAHGKETDHLLNSEAAKTCQILVAGENFGCGSSREHAPWALMDYGIRAVISSRIADIFFNNSLKNGLLPIVIEKWAHNWLLDHPGAEVEIDLEAQEVRLPHNGGTYSFPVDPFSKLCLLQGKDELDYLVGQDAEIARYEAAL